MCLEIVFKKKQNPKTYLMKFYFLNLKSYQRPPMDSHYTYVFNLPFRNFPEVDVPCFALQKGIWDWAGHKLHLFPCVIK